MLNISQKFLFHFAQHWIICIFDVFLHLFSWCFHMYINVLKLLIEKIDLNLNEGSMDRHLLYLRCTWLDLAMPERQTATRCLPPWCPCRLLPSTPPPCSLWRSSSGRGRGGLCPPDPSPAWWSPEHCATPPGVAAQRRGKRQGAPGWGSRWWWAWAKRHLGDSLQT